MIVDKEISDEIKKSLVDYIKRIYLIILGLGFSYFIIKFFDGVYGTYQLIYFFSIYYFISYDWTAYIILINRYPYKISSNILSQGRFYSDYFALVLKGGLIFLSSLTIIAPPNIVSTGTLFSIATLFLLWHFTIIAWFYFAKKEYTESSNEYRELSKNWWPHSIMIIFYCLYIFVLRFYQIKNPILLTLYFVLCMAIVVFATWRRKNLIEKLEENNNSM